MVNKIVRELFAGLGLAMVIVCTVTGCAALGLATPKTFNQQLATGYGSATVVIQTTDTLLKDGKISSQDAQNVEIQADNLKAALDIARQTYATDQATAGNKLAAALTALQALTTYLQSKGG